MQKTIRKGINAMTNNTLTVVNNQSIFKFGDHEIRVVDLGGEPWFVAADVCRALQLSNPSESLKSLESDEINTLSLTEGINSNKAGNPNVNIISESGMYTLVLRCRDAIKQGTTPNRFKNWVTKEVLPQIRKTGQYQSAAYTTNSTDVLTKEQQDIIRQLVTNQASLLPKDKQAGAIIKTWSKLKAHFKVPYRKIPQQEFTEAVSIIQRSATEWELVDDLPETLESAQSEKRMREYYEKRMMIALNMAGVAQMELFRSLLDEDDDSLWMNRFLVSYDQYKNQPYVSKIDRGAIIASPAKLAKMIPIPNDYHASIEDLMNIAKACIERVQNRI